MKITFSKILILLLSIGWMSCLEDDKQPLNPSGTQNVIEFYDPAVPVSPAGSIYPAYVFAFAVSPEASFAMPVSFSGPNENNKDITLTVAVDLTALDDFNAQDGEQYEMLPADMFTLPSTTVTIPKGQTKANVTVTVFPDKFDLTKKYAIPLRIVSSTSGILSARFSTAILAVVAKNKFDGVYATSVGQQGWAAYGIWNGDPLPYPQGYGLVTTGPTSNTLISYYRGDMLQPGFDAAGGATAFGSATPHYFFDDAGNLVDIINLNPDARNRQFRINPDAPADHNVFDLATMTITMDYILSQNGRPDQYIIQIMERTGDRP